MSSDFFKKLAIEFKDARANSNITLEQIHHKTRIDIKYLEAIEDGNFEVMPEVYIRAFIKEYAKAINLDEELIIKKYDLAREGKDIDAETLEQVNYEKQSNKIINKQFVSEPTTQPLPTDVSSKKISSLGLSITSVSLIVLVAISYFIFIKDPAPEIITEKPFKEIMEEQKLRYEELEKKNVPQLVTSADSLTLKITASDTSWINVLIDQEKEEEFILIPNMSKSLFAKNNFKLLIGNSGGIKLFLNDEPLELQGRTGSVRNIKVDADGLEYIKTSTIKKDD
jgi:cytoskeletal protein RodZ